MVTPQRFTTGNRPVSTKAQSVIIIKPSKSDIHSGRVNSNTSRTRWPWPFLNSSEINTGSNSQLQDYF